MTKTHKFLAITTVKIIYGLRNFLDGLSRMILPAQIAVFETSMNFWISKALGTAAELGIPDILKDGPTHIDELAKKTHTDASALYRLMRALAGNGIFKEKNDKTFQNTKLGRALVEGNDPMKYMILHQTNKVNWNLAVELTSAVKQGDSIAESVLGSDIFTYLEKQPESNHFYNKAMTKGSEFLSKTLTNFYDFPTFQTIVDIGGGEGIFLAHLLKKHPHAQGVLIDFDHVISHAPSVLSRLGVADRVSLRSANCLEHIPARADLYLMKNLLHAYNDENCIQILTNIGHVIQTKGKIVIVEMDIDEKNKFSLGKLFDLEMLVGVAGGKERTVEQYDVLLKKSGFHIHQVVKTITPFHLIIGEKNEPLQ